MPNFTKNGTYSGGDIIATLDRCIKKNHNDNIELKGGLSFDESSILLIGKDSNILTNKQMQAFREELNKYTGKFFYNTETQKWEYIYHAFEIGTISMNHRETINEIEYRLGETQFTTPSSISPLYINYFHFDGTVSYFYLKNLDNGDNIEITDVKETIPNIVLSPNTNYQMRIGKQGSANICTVTYYYGEGELI